MSSRLQRGEELRCAPCARGSTRGWSCTSPPETTEDEWKILRRCICEPEVQVYAATPEDVPDREGQAGVYGAFRPTFSFLKSSLCGAVTETRGILKLSLTLGLDRRRLAADSPDRPD